MPHVRHVLTILAIADLSRAVGFYAAAFGWEQAVAAPVYAEFVLPGGMRVGLYERRSFGINTGQVPIAAAAGELLPAELYFFADGRNELDAACARLVAAGARVLSPATKRDWGDTVAYFADPDGNVLALAVGQG
jgi:predicted enzyme related to lactoylglutathione lyase